MSEGSDETWEALVAVAAQLSELSDDPSGARHPVRWRRPFSRRWRVIRTVEAAAEPIETFLRERPDG